MEYVNASQSLITAGVGTRTSDSERRSSSDSIASDRNDHKESTPHHSGVKGLDRQSTTGSSEAVHALSGDQKSSTLPAANVSRHCPHREVLPDTIPSTSRLSPDTLASSNTSSAIQQPYHSFPNPAPTQSSVTTHPLRTLHESATSAAIPLPRNLASPASRPSLGYSPTPAEYVRVKLEREGTNPSVLDQRMAEVRLTQRSYVQGPFAPVPTNVQLQSRRQLRSNQGTCSCGKTLGDATSRHSGFPTDRSLRSLSEVWTLGFQSGMQSTT